MTDDLDQELRASLSDDARMRFDAIYERKAPWDVPFPQPAIVALAAEGLIRGTVLDAGCGSGENALQLAALGLEVWGIDIADSAIGMARAKARARGLPAARFLVADALALGDLGMKFDAVVDSGLFHALSDVERPFYVAGLRDVLNEGGLYVMLCFSELEPGDWGPRRITEADIRGTFDEGFRISRLTRSSFRRTGVPETVQAWLTVIERATLQR